MSDCSSRFAYPTQATLDSVSSGASIEPPVGDRDNDTSLFSDQLRAKIVGMATVADCGTSLDDKWLHQAAGDRRRNGLGRLRGCKSGRPCTRIDLRRRPTSPCCRTRTRSHSSSSSAANKSRPPGKKRQMVAKPCRNSVAADGWMLSGCDSPVSRLVRTPWTPLPRTAHSWSPKCCLMSGISVCTATSISASEVSSPRFGATPVRIHPGRFWYIRPRVPSIGSTMIRQRASLSCVFSEASFGRSASLRQ